MPLIDFLSHLRYPTTDWDLAPYLELRRQRDALLRWPVAALAWLSLPPAAVSLAGVALAAGTLWTFGARPLLALLAFLGALLADALDGALARRLGRGDRRGKLLDQLCDSATFMLVLAALARSDLVGDGWCLLAAGVALGLQPLGIWHHNACHPSLAGIYPGAGFFAHSPKALVYAAVLLWLTLSVNLLELAIITANGLSLVFAFGLAASLRWRRCGRSASP